jgi:hypothetical protein
MDQNAWQRGYTDVAGWTKRKPVFVEAVLIVAGCGFGLTLGSTWWERSLFAVLLAVVAFLLGLIGLWLWLSATAPLRKRDEARAYVRALDAHAREYADWASVCQITEDFRRETLELVNVIGGGRDLEARTGWRSAAELEAHWRTLVDVFSAQLRTHGASEDLLAEVDSQLAALKAKDDSYGDNEIGRIRGSMLAIGQNPWTMHRSKKPPAAPSPPAT